MELSRRDALAALGAAGIALGGIGAYESGSLPEIESGHDVDVKTLVSLATVLYPSSVTEIEEFVRTYVNGRFEADPDHAEATSNAIAVLNEHAKIHHDAKFRELSPDKRDDVLWQMHMTNIEPDPAGSELQRVRYYLVNELLYALFSSPKGGQIVGTENPAGHPGGLEAYQRGPQR